MVKGVLVNIVSYNGWSVWYQAVIWTNDGMLWMDPWTKSIDKFDQVY